MILRWVGHPGIIGINGAFLRYNEAAAQGEYLTTTMDRVLLSWCWPKHDFESWMRMRSNFWVEAYPADLELDEGL